MNKKYGFIIIISILLISNQINAELVGELNIIDISGSNTITGPNGFSYTGTNAVIELTGGPGEYIIELSNSSDWDVYPEDGYSANPESGEGDGSFVIATIPTVTTTAASAIGFMEATSGGEVTFDGGSTVTEKGICWSKSTEPTTSDVKKKDYSGQNPFTKTMYDFVPGETYYIRAYAINGEGTAYGNEVSFTADTYGSASAPSGDGSSGSPYQISSLNELAWMMQNPDTWDSYFELAADIDASASSAWDGGKGYAPIGRQTPTEDQFNGYLEGNGYTISNLYVNRPNTNDVGLFGYTDRNYSQETSYVQNLGMEDVDFTGGYRTAGLISRSTSLVSSCYATGSITGDASNSIAAGIIGQSHKLVKNSYSRASVSAVYEAAGFISFNNSDIENCFSTGAVSDATHSLDGFCNDNDGHGDGTISNCFWDTQTSGQSSSSGGTGKTTAEMKTQSTFTDAGWDFVGETTNGTNDYWSIDGSNNNAYPWLSWEGYDPVNITWDGSEDTDWNTAANWSLDIVPTVSNNPIINSGGNQPVISATGTALCNNLTVNTGATLTIRSTSSGTGSLIVEGTATGNVTVERFLTMDKWHYISGQTNISGTFTDLMGLGTPGSSINQFYRWDESLNSGDDTGFWIDILNGPTGNGTGNEMGQSFTACRGYAVTYKTTDKTLSLSGIPYTDNKTITITKTDASSNPGANLVGNPFCSTIAINTSAQETNNFIDQNSSVLRDDARAVYFWDESQNDYEVKNNASGAIYAAPGQGFMVISKSASESLEFNVSTRKHGSATFYKNGPNDDVARMKLLVNDSENRSNITTIAFLPDMTLGLDPSFDAAKLKGNPDIALYTRLVEDNGVDFAIQALPPLNTEKLEVKIGLDISTAGDYNFKIIESENFDKSTSIKLEDKENGNLINLREVEKYSFNINEHGQIRDRFALHFNNATGIEDTNTETENIRFYVYDNKLYIIDKELKNGTIQLFNMLGQPVMEKRYLEEVNTIDFDLKTGYYVVRIITDKTSMSGKIYVK
ncbi:MAG: T9SS type A sorting domain-containing protein [Bacteroidales bacterium]|nr:T9SS type A sorting domain-containing protein [Bacteroidales bacterium]